MSRKFHEPAIVQVVLGKMQRRDRKHRKREDPEQPPRAGLAAREHGQRNDQHHEPRGQQAKGGDTRHRRPGGGGPGLERRSRGRQRVAGRGQQPVTASEPMARLVARNGMNGKGGQEAERREARHLEDSRRGEAEVADAVNPQRPAFQSTPARAVPGQKAINRRGRHSPRFTRASRAGAHLPHHDEEHAVKDNPRREAQRVNGGSHLGPAHGTQMVGGSMSDLKSKTISG